MRALAIPTPIIAPIRVWELEAGSPKYQVPTFQTMADTRREKTIANPAADPTWITSSAGRRFTMLNATAPEEVRTPRKLKNPDQITAGTAGSVFV
jgi:hypothetical protein